MLFGQNDSRMPWYGYVIANLIVWVFVAIVFVASKSGWFSNVQPTIDRSGIGSLLIFIPISFLIASLYDYFFDRIAGDEHDDDEDEENLPEAEQLIPGADAGSSKQPLS